MNESGNRMKQTSVAMPDSLDEAIESDLGYGDAKAEWIREACRQRLERESICDTVPTQD